ncbi:Rne/Rng family ribonuclease [Roseovarius mucosus]|uniref:Rne/Rng family ribonuclease n=1 Tax=Roseovarius mucosus TaxID=215743 RepID=UPI001C5D0A09|nr:Rne/Rng family ribonuclease [Roseovarius mucosus]
MATKMLIDATHAEETRVVVVDGNKVEEFDFESENKRQIAGNIYLAKVTRVEPSLQAAFVDYGGNRHGFLAFSEIHPDYYQIPVADREALMAEEEALANAQNDEDEDRPRRSSGGEGRSDGRSEGRNSRSRSRSRSRTRAEKTQTDDAVATSEISGMETIDLEDETAATAEVPEATSPMERVAETPVEEPEDNGADEAGEDEPETDTRDHAAQDDEIESVAEEDDSEDIRPVRKPRARRYKIQEVVKVRQIMLVQVVKEERGNKGAALTTYLSLAGRYCVLMPNTARGGGISRKITNAVDRKKLKEIATEIDVPRGAGLIVRTAGAKRTKAEIKRDYEYLQRLWEQIRELTLRSMAPAKIYEEGDLIKRSIRDLYNREIDEVLVEGERGYRIAKDFMKMIMPSHAKNVKHYVDQQPLFARFQVESYLSGMFNPTVQLKSGGYIVIGVTEALVAIDVNSGRATKEGSIEETALKTNLEAAEEVARQLRLRDLAGLIVIDFIDMDERRNNASVEKRLKDKLKTDRARIQVGRISGFGLLEMSRQRLRPGMIEATTQPCPACHGTGLIRSDDSLALSILRQIEEEGVRRRSREVLVKCPVGIANYLMNQKRDHVAQIEGRYGLSVRIEGDPRLVSPDFTMEKFKTATRNVPEVPMAQFVSGTSALMDDIDDEVEDEIDQEAEAEAGDDAKSAPTTGGDGGDKPKKSRRRRSRRRKPKNGNGAERNGEGTDEDREDDDAEASEGSEEQDSAVPAVAAEPEAPVEAPAEVTAEAEAPVVAEEQPKPKRTRAPRKKKEPASAAEAVSDEEAPKAKAAAKPKRTPTPRKKKEPEATAAVSDESSVTAAPEAAVVPTEATPEPVAEVTPEPVAEVTPEPVAEAEAPEPTQAPEPVAETPAPQEEPKPKRRGWWSLG